MSTSREATSKGGNYKRRERGVAAKKKDCYYQQRPFSEKQRKETEEDKEGSQKFQWSTQTRKMVPGHLKEGKHLY